MSFPSDHKVVQHPRGSTATVNAYTGPIGQLVVDTDVKELRLQDGSTAGGTRIVNKAYVDSAVAAVAVAAGNNAQALAGVDTTLRSWPATAFGQFAPKDSPTFTGTPAAPTAATSDNSTKIATTGYVTAKLSGIVGTDVQLAAGTDTVDRLWSALVLSALAPKASPAFTGSPTAPTQATSDNSTKLATTAFVVNYAMPAPYTGSSSGNTDFPIGHIIAADMTSNSSLSFRNQQPANTMRIDDGSAGRYVAGGTGGILAGTWRARGTCGQVSTTTFQLFQRTA